MKIRSALGTVIVITTLSLPFVGPGCAPATPAAHLTNLETTDPLHKPTCKVARTQNRPFIVDWTGSQRTDLEAHLRSAGLVAVRYRGCEMDVLTQCAVGGAYRWVRTTRESEQLVMSDADSLYAQMPLSGIALEGHLARGRGLRVTSTIVGKYVADRPSVMLDDLKKLGGECASATHVVVGVTAGAYEFVSEAKATVGGRVGPIAGGESSAARELIRRSGDERACGGAKSAAAAPPDDCGAMLRLELSEVKCPSTMEFVADKGCVDRAGAASTPSRPVVLASQGPDAEIAAFVKQLTDTTFAAIRGRPYGTTWDSPALHESIPAARAKLPAEDQGVDVIMSALLTEIIARVDEKKIYAFGTAPFVTKDGAVRWGPTSGRFIDVDPATYPTSSLAIVEDTKAPAIMTKIADRVRGSLTQGRCDLRLMDASDFEALPLAAKDREDLSRELLRQATDLSRTCRELPPKPTKVSISNTATRLITLLSTRAGVIGVSTRLDWNYKGDMRLGAVSVGEAR